MMPSMLKRSPRLLLDPPWKFLPSHYIFLVADNPLISSARRTSGLNPAYTRSSATAMPCPTPIHIVESE